MARADYEAFRHTVRRKGMYGNQQDRQYAVCPYDSGILVPDGGETWHCQNCGRLFDQLPENGGTNE